jgi:hypothetical protein
MNLKYNQLNDEMGYKNYKEKTNVLSYYIITFVLLYNYDDFLFWCVNNNGKVIFEFKKTVKNQMNLCYFIEKKYNTKSILNYVLFIENWFEKKKKNMKNKSVKNYGKGINKSKSKKKSNNYLLNNMRMSILDGDFA